MRRNTKLAIAVVLLLLLGAGGMYALYKGVKKYRAEQRKEFRYGGTLGQASEGFKIEEFKGQIMADDILDKVIEDHDLVNVWGVDGAPAAKQRLREKFKVELDNMMVKVSYQDKKQEIAHDVLKSVLKYYSQKMKAATQ